MKPQPHSIMIVAGEASGDAHGAKLIASLRSQFRDLTVFGMGSDQLRSVGVDLLVDSRDLGVVGLVEIFKIYKKLKSAFKVMQKAILERKPDLLILIDYPGFNLRLSKYAKQHGVKVLYYISPQLWAWHRSRIKIIQRTVDTMAVILPFEEEFYQRHRVNVQYVGHPLLTDLDQIPSRKHARTLLNIDNCGPVIALCPGSRRSELQYLLPTLKIVSERLRITYPDCQLLVPVPPTLNEADYHLLADNVKLIKDDFYTVIASSDAAVVASGTATLQVALTTTPMVIIYKVNWLTYRIAKLLVKVPMIGLCNLIADKKIVRELIQNEATPEAICCEVKRIIQDHRYQSKIIHDLNDIAEKLSLPPDGISIDQLVINMLKLSDETKEPRWTTA